MRDKFHLDWVDKQELLQILNTILSIVRFIWTKITIDILGQDDEPGLPEATEALETLRADQVCFDFLANGICRIGDCHDKHRAGKTFRRIWDPYLSF